MAKRQRAFLDQPTGPAYKKQRPMAVSVVPVQPKLNKTQQLQVTRMINRNQEQKSLVSGEIARSMPLLGYITSCSNIPLGNTDNSRIGNHVHLKAINIRLTTLMTDSTNVARLILFKWRENDTFNAPTAGQLLANGPSGAPDVYSTYNRETSDAYMILKDITLVGSNGTSSDSIIQKRIFSVPLKGKTQYYSDIGVAGINKIYWFFISDSAAVPNPGVSWLTELLFTDD